MAGGWSGRTGGTAGSPARAGRARGDAVRSRGPVPGPRRGERPRRAWRLRHPGRRLDHRGRGRARHPAAAPLVAVTGHRHLPHWPAARLVRHPPAAGRPHVRAGPGDRLAPDDDVRVPRRVGAAARPRRARPGRVRRRDRQRSRPVGGEAPAPADHAGVAGRDVVPYRGERGARPARVRADPARLAGRATGEPAGRTGPQGGGRRAPARRARYPRPPRPRPVRHRDEGRLDRQADRPRRRPRGRGNGRAHPGLRHRQGRCAPGGRRGQGPAA